MERVKRQKSIDKIFARYIICFCLFTFSLAMFFLGFTFNGDVLPANYYEKYIERHRKDIASAKDVRLFIPEPCRYVVYNMEGKMIQGNVSVKESSIIWNMIKKNETINGSLFYKIIQRKNEICAVEYTLQPQFTNPVLRKYLPNPEKIFLVLAPTLFIVEVIIFSKSFRKRLEKEMQLLKDATENIQMENLDFEMQHSNILEINDVLFALDKMKNELRNSLNKQWKMEETRKEQMAALAHDIKTPLTILKGNVELLHELNLNLNLEQREFIKNILSESNRIEDYIKALIEIVKSERETELKKKQINLQNFIKDIVEATQLMIRDKKIKVLSNVEGNMPEFFLVDEVALKRAIINVIANAIDYTPSNGEILFNIYTDNKHIGFDIEDSGSGFTQEEMNYATEQFFQGDKSRNSKNHYGMGLYIVKKIVSQHNGAIYLENSKKLSGAKVTLKIPKDLIEGA